MILPLNPRSKNSTNYQINPTTLDENNNSKVYIIEILLDIGASASMVCNDVLYKHHKILKDKKNKWLTIAGSFNNIFVTEIKFKLLELNHIAKIYAKCHLTNKLLTTI